MLRCFSLNYPFCWIWSDFPSKIPDFVNINTAGVTFTNVKMPRSLVQRCRKLWQLVCHPSLAPPLSQHDTNMPTTAYICRNIPCQRFFLATWLLIPARTVLALHTTTQEVMPDEWPRLGALIIANDPLSNMKSKDNILANLYISVY